jgi:protein-tyrosine-phosphatase
MKHPAGNRIALVSADTKPVPVHTKAIVVMRELGIDISGNRSKHIAPGSAAIHGLQ